MGFLSTKTLQDLLGPGLLDEDLEAQEDAPLLGNLQELFLLNKN